MIKREFWLHKIEDAWTKKSLIWLAGVRRSGKTYLCKSIENASYYDCELLRVRKMVEDPEQFFLKHQDKIIVFDEIHRLDNPSEVLKVAADHFPNIKIIATGSSTLDASRKFKDTLTGRKIRIHLTPMLLEESQLFGNIDIEHRMLFGGLPPFFLHNELPEQDIEDWMSDYWSKEILTLHRLGNREAFLKFTQLILSQSGSIFEASRFTEVCAVSRPTIVSYLKILEETYVAYIVRPYSQNSQTEIRLAPKVYGFDTGFVCYARGWSTLHPEAYGVLWEHLVLNNLIGKLPQAHTIRYWRNKQGHEIDFVIHSRESAPPLAIECKWNSEGFSPNNIKIFRKKYPHGKNYVVAMDIVEPFNRKYDDLLVSFVSLEGLIKDLTSRTY